MEEMLRYIFGEMNRSKLTMTKMEKFMRRQHNFNRRLMFFTVTTAACAVVTFINCRETDKTVDKLYSQMRELRNEKDELSEEIERLKHA